MINWLKVLAAIVAGGAISIDDVINTVKKLVATEDQFETLDEQNAFIDLVRARIAAAKADAEREAGL